MKQLGNRDKFNRLWLGMVLAIFVPVITFVLSWRYNFTDPFIKYISEMHTIHKLSSLVSLSVIPNLLLFFVFIWLNRMKSARGVLLSTILYAFLIFILKFV